jgi:hypothetical protein
MDFHLASGLEQKLILPGLHENYDNGAITFKFCAAGIGAAATAIGMVSQMRSFKIFLYDDFMSTGQKPQIRNAIYTIIPSLQNTWPLI